VGRYSPHTDSTRQEMLAELGLENIEQLLRTIPKSLRNVEYKLDRGKTELEVRQRIQELADQNRHLDQASAFLGAGCYRHYVPAAVWAIAGRGEFTTSYTPYQPEVSQGTLQTVFEFQTGIARLTGMPVANASLYDGASAAAEAVLMALRLQKKRSQLLVAGTLHPEYKELLDTYLAGLDINLGTLNADLSGQIDQDSLQEQIGDDCAAVVIQSPNFWGNVEEVEAIAKTVHDAGALLIVVVTDPTTMTVLKTPGEQGADIVAGEAQCLGTPPAFGGPHLGILAARQEHVRQIPGRLVSLTTDNRGQTVYTLTLQTREQHIRRAKATSNICTNQSLMATAAAIYMGLVGPHGMRQMANTSLNHAHQLASRLSQLPGYKLPYTGPFFHEFVLRCPVPAQEMVQRATQMGIYPGVALSNWYDGMDNDLLICTTELNTPAQMDRLVEFCAGIS